MINFIKLYLGLFRRVVSSFLLSPFDEKERVRIANLYAVYQERKVTFPEDPYIIPKTDIFEIENQDTAIYEGVDECGFGHITEFELKVICHIVRKYQPKTIFEIGTFEGRTTLNIALNTAADAKIFTLDLPASELDKTSMNIEAGEVAYVDKKESGGRFLGSPQKVKITQLYGDSGTYDFSLYADTIDFMFVDGSHAHDYVINDTEKALKMVKKGGVILWHDYTNWEGVKDVLNNFYKNHAGFSTLRHIGGTSIVMMIR